MFKLESQSLCTDNIDGTTDYAKYSEAALRPLSRLVSNISFYGNMIFTPVDKWNKRSFLKCLDTASTDILEMSKESLLEYIRTARRNRNNPQLFCALTELFVKETNAEISPDIWNSYRMFTGCAIDSPTNERSILSLGVVAAAHTLYNQPVHIISHDEERLLNILNKLDSVFNIMGFSSGFVGKKTGFSDRREQYSRRICFCLSSELVFDYLRDRLILDDMTQALRLQAEILYRDGKARMNNLMLRGLHVALIESMEIVLVDESKKPLEITASQVKDHTISQPKQEQTLIRLSYPGFFRRYKNLSGFGLLESIKNELWDLYRLPVEMKIPGRYQMSDSSFRSIVKYNFEMDESSKWDALLDSLNYYIGKNPCWVSVKTQENFDILKKILDENEIIFEMKSIGQGNLELSTDKHSVSIIYDMADSMYIPEDGVLFLFEYYTIQQVERCKSFMAKQKNTGIECIISMDDSGLNEVVVSNPGLRLMKWLFVSAVRTFPRILSLKDSFFGRILLHLVNKTNTAIQKNIRIALVSQEMKKQKMLSFSARR